MKKSLKIMAAVLAAGLSLTSFVGCKSKTSSPNSASDIEISFWVAGFGETFMDKIIDGFNAKYPEYHAYKTSGRNSTTLVNSLKLGKNDTTDIYFSATDVLINYHDMFMDLSDIAESKIDGEDRLKIPTEASIRSVGRARFRVLCTTPTLSTARLIKFPKRRVSFNSWRLRSATTKNIIFRTLRHS